MLHKSIHLCHLCNQVIFLFDLDHQQYETLLETFKSKKPSLDLRHGPVAPVPATLTSTPITITTNLMPFIPASDATASAQVTAGVSVSVQLCPSHL